MKFVARAGDCIFKGLLFALISSLAIGILFALMAAVPPSLKELSQIGSVTLAAVGVAAFSVPFTCGPAFLAHIPMYCTRDARKRTFIAVATLASIGAAALTLLELPNPNLEPVFQGDPNATGLWLFCAAAAALMTWLAVKIVWQDPARANPVK